MVLTYDEHGDLDVKVVKSSEKTTQSIALRKIIDNWSETVEDAAGGELKTPKNRTYIYGTVSYTHLTLPTNREV